MCVRAREPAALDSRAMNPSPFRPVHLRGRAHVRNLFLRLLGLVFLVAFVSLYAQVRVLFGPQGLLPACEYLHGSSQSVTLLETPTIFWFDCSEETQRDAALIGGFLSL